MAFPMKWAGDTCDRVKKDIPNVDIESNLEQIIAMARLNEIARICIIFGSFDRDGHECAEKIHAANPNIPILIWDSLNLPEIHRKNEIYLNSGDYETEEYWNIFYKFYSGTLTELDPINYKKSQ